MRVAVLAEQLRLQSSMTTLVTTFKVTHLGGSLFMRLVWFWLRDWNLRERIYH